ncbi:prepilin-type N-terminal cleavage/methylation domain-containing protein [Candidatus Dojkabacteria bacterium]|nr:prepilin-type N-terminal cleavage/methylation domain-containing protein [Candidatus Dojkabacteria bacterium]
MFTFNSKGFTLVEIVLTIAIGAILVSGVTLGLLTYRNNLQYDILLNQIDESVSYAKAKALSGKLDSLNQHSSYGVMFFEDRFIEFEGDEYVEGAVPNVEYNVPVGLRLSATCVPSNNGSVVFSRILGENSNYCTVSIYKFEQTEPAGSVRIGRFGVEEAL